jgi:hypothetical protein
MTQRNIVDFIISSGVFEACVVINLRVLMINLMYSVTHEGLIWNK